MTTTAARGIDPKLVKGWAHQIEKENMLRLKWFRKNEERLAEIAHQKPSRVVPDEMKESLKRERVEAYQNMDRKPRIKISDTVPEVPGVLQGIMKPVDPATKKLIYTGLNKDGRMNYLNVRVHILPEERYYFPEVTSFEYGWKMQDYLRNLKKTGFGRQQVIKDSFYRRQGILRDPDWYRAPAVISPTFCSCKL